MKFEIDVDIPDGYEPTGEYRYPRSGEPFMSPLEVKATTTFNPRGTGRRLILREKPLTYEDFERVEVRSTNGTVELHAWVWLEGGRVCWSAGRTRQPDKAREVAAALIAAADHVDRVNAQNNNRA